MGEYLALVYENWRSTRGFYLFCLWFGLYGAFSMWIFAQIQPERFDWGTDSSAESLVVLFSMSQVVWLFMLIAASGELNDLKFTIPQFHLRLPVSTWKLVAARMSFGVLSNFVMAIVYASVLLVSIDSSLRDISLVPLLLMFWVFMYLVHQVIAWTIGRLGIVPTLVAYIVGIFFVQTLANTYKFYPDDLAELSPVWLVIILLVSYVIAVISIRDHRKRLNTGAGFSIPIARNKVLSGSVLDSEGFASKDAALRWFQYRDQLSLYPWIVVASCLSNFVIIRSVANSTDLRTMNTLFLSVYLGANFGTWLLGIILLVRGWGPLLKKDKMFLFVRPVSTLELIRARWEANARAVVLCVVPMLGLCAVALAGFPNPSLPGDSTTVVESLMGEYSLSYTSLMALCTVVFLCIVNWAMLWMENIMGVCIIGGVVAIVFTVLSVLISAFIGLVPVYIAEAGFLTAFLIVIGLLVLLFRRNQKNDLMSKNHLYSAIASVPFVLAWWIFIFNPAQGTDLGSFDFYSTVIGCGCFALLIVSPIITGPAIMQWARHRK